MANEETQKLHELRQQLAAAQEELKKIKLGAKKVVIREDLPSGETIVHRDYEPEVREAIEAARTKVRELKFAIAMHNVTYDQSLVDENIILSVSVEIVCSESRDIDPLEAMSCTGGQPFTLFPTKEIGLAEPF